mmetsp:Transcript_17053/g.41096  ORF Transcript_17053/g.41096 Transcript_17053/m.41096 type:complete len:146 (+) Transcript_17053:227-664(+)
MSRQMVPELQDVQRYCCRACACFVGIDCFVAGFRGLCYVPLPGMLWCRDRGAVHVALLGFSCVPRLWQSCVSQSTVCYNVVKAEPFVAAWVRRARESHARRAGWLGCLECSACITPCQSLQRGTSALLFKAAATLTGFCFLSRSW